MIEDLKKVFTDSANEAKLIANKDIFLIAMAVGFNAKNFQPEVKSSGTGVRIQYLGPADNLLIAALQVAQTNDSKSLLDIEELYDLAERYAAGGVSILYEFLKAEGDFSEWFASHVIGPLREATATEGSVAD